MSKDEDGTQAYIQESTYPKIGLSRNPPTLGAQYGAGARTLGVDPALAETSGAYFDGHDRQLSSTASDDSTLAVELWAASCQLTGLTSADSNLSF